MALGDRAHVVVGSGIDAEQRRAAVLLQRHPLWPVYRRPRKSAQARRERGVLRPALSLLAGILVWEAIGWILALPWVPPFSQVVAGLVELTLNGEILGNLATTLQTLAIGFILSLAIGLPVGALMGRFKRVEQALGIFVYTGILIPSLAMAPIYFAIFGLSSMSRIMIVVQFAVFFLIVNTATAFRTVDSSLEEMGRCFGANRRQNIWQIVLPGSTVLLFAGIRIAVGRSVKGMISAEMFIAVVGLGGVLQKYGTQFDASKVLAVALITLVLAVVLGALARVVERRFTSWAE